MSGVVGRGMGYPRMRNVSASVFTEASSGWLASVEAVGGVVTGVEAPELVTELWVEDNVEPIVDCAGGCIVKCMIFVSELFLQVGLMLMLKMKSISPLQTRFIWLPIALNSVTTLCLLSLLPHLPPLPSREASPTSALPTADPLHT